MSSSNRVLDEQAVFFELILSCLLLRSTGDSAKNLKDGASDSYGYLRRQMERF
jgi:hypothetical protein